MGGGWLGMFVLRIPFDVSQCAMRSTFYDFTIYSVNNPRLHKPVHTTSQQYMLKNGSR